MKHFTKSILSLLLITSAQVALAKGITVSDPYVREVPPGQQISASFMTIKNDNAHAVALVKASSAVAKTVELHEHVHENGMMKMRPVPKIIIPAKGVTPLKPGGYHVMLIGLYRKIKAGDKVKINLEFNTGEKQTVMATVKKVMMGMKMGNMNKMKNHQDMKHKMPNMN